MSQIQFLHGIIINHQCTSIYIALPPGREKLLYGAMEECKSLGWRGFSAALTQSSWPRMPHLCGDETDGLPATLLQLISVSPEKLSLCLIPHLSFHSQSDS